MVRQRKKLPAPLALIPTMGALHDGHLSLIKTARDRGANSIIVTIFVNPTQFAPGEDFAKYPRPLHDDLQHLAGAGVELVWIPLVATIYPPDYSTLIVVPDLSHSFEGEIRPHHFTGVATVVTRLLRLIKPDLAVFGEKDYQQLLIIRRLVRDLELGVEIVSAPIFRNPRGLALSSRNQYLSDSGYIQAANLSRVLFETGINLRSGKEISECIKKANRSLKSAGFTKIDYFDLVVDGTLDLVKTKSLDESSPPTRMLAAARLEGIRLLDNWLV